uniref:G_PROTEIN_RECEP_F1_2 domain-containing protein n=1 Tax=Panagrellus redivivus TaxID=6233 RepID=A0A7E5A1H7_PANRE
MSSIQDSGDTNWMKWKTRLWEHKVIIGVGVILLILSFFPFWVVLTYIIDSFPYRNYSFALDDVKYKSNENYTISCVTPQVTDDVRLRGSVLSIYAIIFATGAFGNSLVVYVIFNNERMRTVTNMFIANLAISDLLVSCTSLWLTPLYTFTGYWIWGGWLCYGFPLFQGTSIFISTLTLMSIAIDRYFVICHHSMVNANMNDHLTMPVCLALITLIWTVSLSLVMPYAIHMRLAYVHQPCNYFICIEDWSRVGLKSIFGIVVLAIQFIIPFTIIFFSYFKIWSFLNQRFKMTTGRKPYESKRENTRRRKLLRMLITMVLVFGVCWLPLNTLNVMRDFVGHAPLQPYFTMAYIGAHMISMLGTAFNPILYAWMNDNFRECFIKTVPLLRWVLSEKAESQRESSNKVVITDCAPASNRINCGDNVSGRRRLTRSFNNSNTTIITTTKIPDFSSLGCDREIGEAFWRGATETSQLIHSENDEALRIRSASALETSTADPTYTVEKAEKLLKSPEK